MSIFGKIKDAIFVKKAQAAPAPTPETTPAIGAPAAPQPAPTLAPAAPTAISEVDVIASLESKAASHPEKLNWRSSIVDLMKLLDIDSSLQNRRELADELGFTGDKDDSASMNIWLHKQVMRELAANGGKVPADLTD